MLNFK